MEALIFMFDVACMTYVCWRVYKLDPRKPRPEELGFFQYRVHDPHAAAGDSRPGGPGKGRPNGAKGSNGQAQGGSGGRSGA